LLALLFDPEDGSNIFFRNIGLFELHGVTTQKTVLFIVTAAITSNSTYDFIRFYMGKKLAMYLSLSLSLSLSLNFERESYID
jgi:hypothetical protein